MQSAGAEMLRLACNLIVEQGVTLCAPVHDAVLVEADADSIDEAVADHPQLHGYRVGDSARWFGDRH